MGMQARSRAPLNKSLCAFLECPPQFDTMLVRGVEMSVSLKSLGIDQLSIEERLALVEELWDSIAESTGELPLTEAQQSELDRRLAEHEAYPNDVAPWEDVKASIEARLKR
jgi:putative addiction module component (TIGR02574 family)